MYWKAPFRVAVETGFVADGFVADASNLFQSEYLWALKEGKVY